MTAITRSAIDEVLPRRFRAKEKMQWAQAIVQLLLEKHFVSLQSPPFLDIHIGNKTRSIHVPEYTIGKLKVLYITPFTGLGTDEIDYSIEIYDASRKVFSARWIRIFTDLEIVAFKKGAWLYELV